MSDQGNPLVAGWSARVDYVTMTFKQVKAMRSVAEEMYDFLEAQTEAGYNVSSFEAHGYKGWRCNGRVYGERAADVMIQLQGEQATLAWDAFFKRCSTISRFDVCVTVLLREPDKDLAWKHYVDIQTAHAEEPRILNYSLIQTLLGGATLYVGKRESRLFGRLYDKASESGIDEPGRVWRYEVELKKPLAMDLAGLLFGSVDLERLIAQYVFDYFEKRGIIPLFVPNGETIIIVQKRRETDDERTLKWFEKQVAPAFARLKENGRLEDALTALGIPVIPSSEL